MIDGKKYVKSTKTTDKKLATKIDQSYYQTALEQSKLGGDTITFKEALELYAGQHQATDAYGKSITTIINWLNQNTDTSLPMTKIDNKFLYEFVRKRSVDCKPATVKHNLGVIIRVIKLSKKMGYDVCTVEPPSIKVKNHKSRTLSKNEEEKLINSFLVDKGRGMTKKNKQHLAEWHDITICLFGTGCRINEILELTWDQVDFESRILNIWRKKTSTSSVLPMSDRVFDVLSKRTRNSTYVFPNDELTSPRRYSSVVFQKACKRAGIEDVTWHTIRHHRITEYAKSGLSIPQIMTLSGHSSFASLQRYTHLSSPDVVEKARLILNN